MSIAYDPSTNAVYLRFARGSVVSSQEVAPGIVLDFDAGDRVVAIEILEAGGVLETDQIETAARPQVRLVAASGEACPVSGLWRVVDGGKRVAVAEGQPMPRLDGRDVTWLLATAA